MEVALEAVIGIGTGLGPVGQARIVRFRPEVRDGAERAAHLEGSGGPPRRLRSTRLAMMIRSSGCSDDSAMKSVLSLRWVARLLALVLVVVLLAYAGLSWKLCHLAG
jgi:hypothetical protein